MAFPHPLPPGHPWSPLLLQLGRSCSTLEVSACPAAAPGWATGGGCRLRAGAGKRPRGSRSAPLRQQIVIAAADTHGFGLFSF